MSEQTYVVFLLPLRLFTGWVFLWESMSKLTGGFVEHDKLAGLISGWMKEGKPYWFYTPFLRDLVLPHASLFSWLVIGGELVVGAAMLAGLFTRAASLLGLVLVLNFLLARGDSVGPNATAPMLAILLTLTLTHTGRTLGLDAALRGKLPRWLG
jgi:thiosulfate dehydrogenase [quinone] large subunit